MIEVEASGSISDIIELLEQNSKHFKSRWFRGHSKKSYTLSPTIFRGTILGEAYDEAGMIREFKRRYPEQSSTHKSIFEWLTLMQHYGLPTRLLDWTSSLLVALYFACENENDEGCIFALDPSILDSKHVSVDFMACQAQARNKGEMYRYVINEMQFDGRCKLNGLALADIRNNISTLIEYIGEYNEEPVFSSFEQPVTILGMPKDFQALYDTSLEIFSGVAAYKSPFLNERVKQQQGHFTVHGGKHFSGSTFLTPMGLEEHPRLLRSLIKINIPHTLKAVIQRELTYAGVSEANLFPDMHIQAKDIKKQFTI